MKLKKHAEKKGQSVISGFAKVIRQLKLTKEEKSFGYIIFCFELYNYFKNY
jgi:hypothetical protein